MIDADHGSKVIGYFAVCDDQILLDQNACIVVGDDVLLQQFIDSQVPRNAFGQPVEFRPRKIRYRAIAAGISGGGTYAFDETAYQRFIEVANGNGFYLNPNAFADTSTKERAEINPADSSGGASVSLSLVTVPVND